MIRYVLLIALVVSFSSCSKRKAKKQAKEDEEIIQKYISDNKLNATATGSGLYYVMSTQGTGVNPSISSNVTVVYSGYFTDGSTFDQSTSAGISFDLSSVIKGWQEGIPYFKKGGKGMLIIPSALAYGPSGTSGVPPNSVLVFNIHLLDVK
ncbi:MAG: FKBP-type peptidyl-prolyl cis-trans isomerase [Sphingobacteriaceae bacterium]|jgi:FKBP-type peptidyl-prolyl cis-trans isomerase FkpA|nr:FKBP-type peptidyl-prolyl cis-trans isomerase [Sphingobacteriaceae bacterium]MBK7310924.1 FKBP-type peptidyl-prolyl cis-trans isomerase [Sphingobacteriaceae bacterium]MBK7817322.1 FKBP-type peptidyl-prolyl cis-trans isomerase [Sphingobacteriaceae bacterium]